MPRNFFPKKAMVLAAGLGTRMRSHRSDIPKPLVPVADKSLVDWSLDLLQASNIQEVVVNRHYMADKLEAHLAQRTTPRIIGSYEEILLETGGGITKALPLLGEEPFFVLNSDVICLNGATPLLQRMAECWDESEMDALLLVTPTSRATGYEGQGDFAMDETGNLRRRHEGETVPFVFTGAQLLHPRLFKNAPEGAFSMNLLYNRDMDAEKNLHRVRGITHDGAWLHVGDANGVMEAEKFLAAEKVIRF